MRHQTFWLWRWTGLLLVATVLKTACVAQLVQEHVIARGQIRNLSVSYLANNRIYVATSDVVMLAVYDDSGSHSTLLGTINYPGNVPRPATAILVDGNYAYIHYEAGSGGRLAVIDVSNPASMTLAGELSFPSAHPTYISMAKSGNFLYLFAYQRDFAVVNVSNPSNPTLVRMVTATASAGVVVGNRLYTAEGANGVRVWDISQPDNPTLVHTVSGISNIGRVAAAGGRLYALRSYGPPLQLHILDLSNPDAPALVGNYATERVAGLAATDNYVLVSGYERGTEVVDVSNPASPISVRVLPNHYVQNADSTRALIQGQSILVLHNPATNHTRSTIFPYPLKAVRRGNFVYAVMEQSVWAFDISNPSMPTIRGTADLELQRESNTDIALVGASHLAVSSGGVLYVFEHTGSNLNQVVRLDPGGFSTPGFGDRLRVSGSNLAMMTRSGQVQLHDLTTPDSPALRGSISSSTGKFDLMGNTLYDVMGGSVRVLRVFDVSDPDNPVQQGSVALPQVDLISDIAAGAGYVLTSDWQGNLALVDARVPSNPQVVAQSSLTGVSNPQVAFDGTAGVFYVYDGLNRKVVMFRVSDFPSLTPAANFTLDREMYRLTFYNEKVLGAGRGEGLILYRNTLLGGPVMSVTGITPSRGANRGRLSVRIIGTGFTNGCTVRLERGSEQINAVEVQFLSNAELNAVFEFNGQPENTQWDVVVRNPDNQEARLVNGFSIVEAIPAITSISPGNAYPLSNLTITINGSLFTPGAQVTLLPPDGVSVEPITASAVQHASQNRLQATFNLSPYQTLIIVYGLTARLQVRNPNNRESNLMNFTINAPHLSLSVARSVGLPADANSVAVEVEVTNSVPTEPIRFHLSTAVSGEERLVEPSQVQSLGGSRWRLVIPTSALLPDNFAWNWTLYAHQLGSRTGNTLTFYRPYAAQLAYPVNLTNLAQEATLEVKVTSDHPNVTVVLRQGNQTVAPSQVSRAADNWLHGVTRLTLRYPIRLQDVGTWNAEVRFDDQRTVQLANALQVRKGSLLVNSFEWTQSFAVFGTLHAHLRTTPLLEDVQVAVRLPEPNVLNRTELVATRVRRSEDGTHLIAEFEGVEAAFTGDAYTEIEVRHPLLEKGRRWSYQPIRAGTLQSSVYVWVPVGYRAGRVNTIGEIYLYNRAPYPETPYLEFPIPVRETVLQSGQFQAEYKVLLNGSEVVAEGVLPLTPDNHTIRAVLKPVRPNQYVYYAVQVRFVPTNRSAPPVLRGRIVPVVVIAVVGATVLLSYLGHELLDATCNSTILVQAIRRRIAEELEDPLDTPDESEIRRLLRILYDDQAKKGFVQTVLQGVTIDYLVGLGEDAAKQFLAGRIQQYLQRRLPEERAELIAETAADLAGHMYKFAKGDISYADLLGQLFGEFLPSLPANVAKKAVDTMLEKGKECLEKVDTLTKIYTHRTRTSERADVGFSYDPNEKNGAAGISGYLRADEHLAYEIKFENLASATAGAEEVLIEDRLPEGLDLSTLEFLSVQVGTQRRLLPPGTTALNLDIDLRPTRPVIVQVRSELDPNTRTLRVRYKGIDPNTGDYYEGGFLPPNQNPPHGEGSVVFRLRPLSSAPSGTQFVNRATIIFDPHLGVNAPIVTNAHVITLDKQPPSVVVEVPANAVPETKAELNWQASDDASGVEEVEIWAQEGSSMRRIGLTRASGERTETGRVRIRARRFGDETRSLTRARDRVGNLAPLGDQPAATLRMGQVPPFSAGLHLIGMPLRPDAPDMQPLFGFQNNQWATYNPATGQYVQYPDANAAPRIGQGYWVLLPNAVQPSLVGDLPDPDQRVAIPLQPGWNLIANPWTEPLLWHRQAVQVRVQGVARPLAEATDFVEPYLWGWEPNTSNPQ
ncbi:MAG: hypothetical protein ABDI19_01320, partial [Armatimonadota bacterium]